MKRKLFYGLLLAPVILLGLLSIVATGSGNGDGNRDGDGDGNRLSFVIKNDMRSEQLLQGVTIALYDTDDRTIIQTKISDANGVVDFGDIGRNRATFTLAYEDMAGNRSIDTSINVLVAENIIYYMGNADANNPIATVDLSLSNIPTNAGYTMFDPFLDAYQNHLDGFDKLTSIPVGTAHLQNDGKLSLLAMTYDDMFQTTLTDYGYLLDQTVTNGASYEISLHRKPLNLDWTTSPVTVLNSLYILGRRDGVFYNLGLFHDRGPQTASGSMPIAHEFPVDHYLVSAWTDSSATKLSSYTNHDTLAQPILVSLPDYSIDSFDYAEATRTFGWKITGDSPRDYVSLNFVSFDDAEQLLEWTVNMAEDASGWQIIDLPAPANTWVDTTDIVNSVDINVMVCDQDNVSNRDQLWQLFISGEFTVETLQYLHCGSFILAQKAMTTNLAGKALTSPRTQDAYIRNIPGLLGKSSGHLRH